MSGRSFMTATRMPMPESSYETWLDTPLPPLDIIENRAAFDTDWELTAIAGSPAAVAHYRAARTSTPRRLLEARKGLGIVRYRDGAAEIYLYDYHHDTYGTQTDLLMLAGAGRFLAGDTAVLHWGGDVHPGLPLNGQSPLALLLTGPGGARFTTRYPINDLIDVLTPLETDFLAAAEQAG
ncbi:hypothetical protein ACFY36_16890 [Actinoplanes sp. NPDC000266]